MKTGFNGAGGIGGSSVRWHRRLRQGGGEAKVAFDTSGGGGDSGEGGSSIGICVGIRGGATTTCGGGGRH